MYFELKTALRDSETATRPYVLVNPMLAKHLPVSPSAALDCFAELGRRVAANCKGERVLVIGFAETATAVGAAVANEIENAVYVHTTRETIHIDKKIDFLEEHSHAKDMSLYLCSLINKLSEYDRIVFVEDEITTGKTILNLLDKITYSGKITVSALVFNGLDKSVFSRYGADFFCLNETGYARYLDAPMPDAPTMPIPMHIYLKRCAATAGSIIRLLDKSDIENKHILVIGTEEFMYPALILGRELEKTAASVKSQSTTRSPLLPKDDAGYPFFSRDAFASVYDKNRTTYLYNLEQYDTVIIMTDAFEGDSASLIRAVQNRGNQTVYYIGKKYDDGYPV